MEQVTPAIRDLARLLLAVEAHRSGHPEGEAHAAQSAFELLGLHLSKLVGVAGLQALLVRALAMAKPEASWLAAVRVQGDATLEGFSETAQQQSAEAIAEGSAALLAQLLGLLVTFIGEALTLRLVRGAWPEAQLEDRNLGAEETSA